MAQVSPKPTELGGARAAIAVVLVLLSLAGGALWGWRLSGPMGGLLGVLLGAAVGALVFTLMRATVTAQQLAERDAPDVRELPPDQAIQVLSAFMSAGASSGDSLVSMTAFAGGLLGEVGKARSLAKKGDPEGAIAMLDGLAKDNPRSPAIPAELARIYRKQDELDASRSAATRAIQLALTGGMNRLAAKVFSELEDEDRDELGLSSEEWLTLGKVLDNAGDTFVGLAVLAHERTK
ncbi:hypothetical protein G6O69_22440 [Pseudenhygromyxa sp. WMMC2535]|uniref:tetratricopeptide repeat protein n=1 Tax=Pseudenhygromyxa sp. WMMC2535 TaxID=2712867 RepID=UPI001556BDFC|nr:tetratricopeptide repeat protein [Pseudenhygromyxa sp. WMMC2535]NVB40616.1 hypothetical protein [Pseudenhygromyxa sp. WMMC2535]